MTATRAACCGVLTLAATVACAPTAQPKPKDAVASPPPAAILIDENWGRFRSRRHGLSVPFPDGTSWRIDDHSSQWLDATHVAGVRVRLRSWVEPKPVSWQHCEREARRLAPDIPFRQEGGAIDEYVSHELFAPDFTSGVVVGLSAADPHTQTLQGHVLAFGASARRCVIYWFHASANGPKGAPMLGDRLELGTRIAENIIYVARLPDGPLESISPPQPRR